MKKRSTKKASVAAERRRKSGPSKASLRDIPPVVDAEAVEFARGPEGLREMLAYARRGRPKKGEKAAGTVTKSVRLPKSTWLELEQVAKARGVTVHALMREAVAKVLAA